MGQEGQKLMHRSPTVRCSEGGAPSDLAVLDPSLRDPRVLSQLLDNEHSSQPPLSSMECVPDLQVRIRSKVIDYMVHQVEFCENYVFTLAVNYLDRCIFSMTLSDDDDELYALGGACLFLANKLQATNPESAENLVMRTSDLFDKRQLLTMEKKVLISLEWKLSAITALDFVQQILHRLVIPSDDLSFVLNCAETCAMLSITDLKFAIRRPSLIAAGSVYATIMRMEWLKETWPGITTALDKISTIINITPECVRACQEEMDVFL
uniref:G1/S-specific cyclin-D2-like n=1 Tax=Myxine glutinosa TaxID=7769 RepID=UPI00358F1C80